MQLVISNNSASNPLSLDLTRFIDVQDGDGMDPANPAFSSRVIAHSLLKPGGFLALEDLQAKELVFPLDVNSTTQSLMIGLITQINQIINSPGATVSWQDDGLSQATTFDMYSGQFDVAYNYRRAGAKRTKGNLRLFTAPLGRTPAPRPFAAASGAGPILMITPYASGGALAIGASTQAGAAGFGGAPGGASSGIFYPGAPSLAGDATAQLQMTLAGPNTQFVAAVSKLPDKYYQPLVTSNDFSAIFSTHKVADAMGVANQYVNVAGPSSTIVAFFPTGRSGSTTAITPPVSWAGDHRMLGIARASGATGFLTTFADDLIRQSVVASVTTGNGWCVMDLGVLSLRASQLPGEAAAVTVSASTAGTAVDITAIVMLPDANTWFLAHEPYNRQTVVLDDVLGGQFAYGPFPTPNAPSATGAAASSYPISSLSRGLIPSPDPKDGPPILAAFGVASQIPLTQARLSAQVNVLERARYVLP